MDRVGETKCLDRIRNRIIIPCMKTRNIPENIAAAAVAPRPFRMPENPCARLDWMQL
jgi:hypothetical protein